MLDVNDNQYHEYRPAFDLDFTRNPMIIIKKRLPFSQLHEMRITFISSYEMMTYKN